MKDTPKKRKDNSTNQHKWEGFRVYGDPGVPQSAEFKNNGSSHEHQQSTEQSLYMKWGK